MCQVGRSRPRRKLVCRAWTPHAGSFHPNHLNTDSLSVRCLKVARTNFHCPWELPRSCSILWCAFWSARPYVLSLPSAVLTATASWEPPSESDERAGLLSSLSTKGRKSSPMPLSISPRALSSLVAMLQSVEVLCNLAILYLFKDDFQIDPASVTVVMGCLRIPWTVKPLWALMADNCSLCGSRRKSYIIVGAAACMAATLGIGLGGYRSLSATTSLLLLYFWGSAVCNVIGEALVVEAGREGSTPGATARTVSTFFAFRKISFATMSYLSGLLLAYIDKRFIFIIAAALPFTVFAAAFFLEEPHVQSRPIREQINELIRVVKRPVLLNSTLFTFIMMVRM